MTIAILALLALAGAAAPAASPADNLPKGVVAQAAIAGQPELLLVEAGDRMFIAPRGSGPAGNPIELIEPDVLLVILADQRLAPMWAPIVKWAGPDLVLQRERRLKRARENVVRNSPSGSASENERQASFSVRAQLQLADALEESGRSGEATELLRSLIAEAEADVKRRDEFDAVQLRIKLAHLHHKNGETARALAILEEGESAPDVGADYKLNYSVNRAAMLAETGRFGEALTLIDRALAVSRDGIPADANRIEGSELEYRWIRACALKGLGRDAEAAEAYAPVQAAGGGKQLRALLCMRNVEGLAGYIAKSVSEGATPLAIASIVQPGWSRLPGAEVIAAAVKRPEVVAAMAGKVRMLPPELLPAVRHWRE